MIEHYKKNQIVFREGDTAENIFELRWGSIGIYTGYKTKTQKLLMRLQGEGCLGVFAVLDDTGYKATAVALQKDTQIDVVPKEQFYDFFKDRPAKLLAITESLCHLQRDTIASYVNVCKRIAEIEAEEESEE